ncbi:hypothetical protein OG264_15980 [Streptomyces xanthophaeus]|uniref:hypothetical protein n=1 Tax=Streptomyces xanthophaeus TaxID=67385 RepID=UPI00386D5211|nr:hypothetical protein OG264_15980 [Streptomyces xanthophaeus]WST62167.1 hypothetical protein OG605_22455 [Streptomyces xanthophaeus]
MRVSAAVVMQMHRDGYSDQQISDQTGAALADVRAILDTHKSLVARGDIPAVKAPPPVPDAVALLAWASGHSAAAVRRHADRALSALEAIGVQHRQETELRTVATEVARLEQRLAALKTREAEIKGRGRPKIPSTAPARDYTPSEVRAWAQQAGVDCPPMGIVPKPVLAAWRAATGRTS